jgi:DME family drug/metabolite transporter
LASFSSKPSAAWRHALSHEVIGWVLLAALATGVYQISFMHAVAHLGAALGTTIALGIAPAATGLCARWWTRERFTRGWMLGTLAAVVGCAVLLNPWTAIQPNIAGIGMALLAGACYGVYTVAGKRFLQAGVPALPAATITLIVAGLALSPLLALHPDHLTDPDSLLLIAWIGPAGTAAAYAAFIHGLHHTTAATAGTLSLAEPLLAGALGVLLLREHLSASVVIGCVILITGLATVTVSMPFANRSRGPSERTKGSSNSTPHTPTMLCSNEAEETVNR